MIVASIEELRHLDLPSIPPDFFQEEYVAAKKVRSLPVGEVVCLRLHYHDREYYNPEGVWGYVEQRGPYVKRPNGVLNLYLGGELCTLEEFMSEHGNVLPFSWRN